MNFLMKGPEYLVLRKAERDKVEKQFFMTSNSAHSPTVKTTAKLHKSFMAGPQNNIDNPYGRNDNGQYYFIDTPGMADSAGQDIQFLRDMIQVFKTDHQFINLFMFYISEQRIDSTSKEVIKLLEDAFGTTIWANFIFLFRVPNGDDDLYLLEIDSKEDYINERASIIEEEFKIPKNSLRVYGMDIFKDFRQ